MFVGWLFASNTVYCQSAPGEIVGTIVNDLSGEILYGAQAFVKDQDQKYQALTDEDGRFRISSIPAGNYLMSIKFHNDTMIGIPVNVPMDGIYQSGTIRFSSLKELKGVTVSGNNGDMKLVYGSLPIKEITQEDIQNSPSKFDIKGLITANNPDVKMDEDGELMFRGARKGDMVYMLDGVKGNAVSNVPSCSIGRMMVYTGGIPAKYGDTLGGVVVVETLSYFDLYRDWKRQENKKLNP